MVASCRVSGVVPATYGKPDRPEEASSQLPAHATKNGAECCFLTNMPPNDCVVRPSMGDSFVSQFEVSHLFNLFFFPPFDEELPLVRSLTPISFGSFPFFPGWFSAKMA